MTNLLGQPGLQRLFFSVRRPLAASMAFVILVLVSLLSIPGIQLQVFPSTANGQVLVTFRAPGESAQTISQTATLPFERILGSLNAIEYVESESFAGYSTVRVDFGSEKTMETFLPEFERVLNSFAPAGQTGIAYGKSIEIIDINARPIAEFILGSEILSTLELGTIAREILIPRLEQNELLAFGVLEGDRKERTSLTFKRSDLQTHDLTLQEAAELLQDQISPASELQFGDARAKISLLYGPALSILHQESGESFSLRPGLSGTVVRDVDETPFVANIAAGGHQEVIRLRVIKKAQADLTQAVGSAVRIVQEVEKEMSDLGFDLQVRLVQSSAEFIEESISIVTNSLIFSLVFTAAALFLMLGTAAYAVPITLSIPAAFLFSLLGFRVFGVSLNVLSLAGLILAIGLVVDNGIVVIEAYDRHFRSNGDKKSALSRGLYEVTVPMLTSSATTVAALIPLFFLSDRISSVFGDLALSIILSLVSSFISAVILLPGLLMLFTPRGRFRRMTNRVWTLLEHRYRAQVSFLHGRRQIPALLVIGVLVVGGVSFALNEKTFLDSSSGSRELVNFQSSRDLTQADAATIVQETANLLLQHGAEQDQVSHLLSFSSGYRYDPLRGRGFESPGWNYLSLPSVVASEEVHADVRRAILSLDPQAIVELPETETSPIDLLLSLEEQKDRIRIASPNYQSLKAYGDFLTDLAQATLTEVRSETLSIERPLPALQIIPGTQEQDLQTLEQLLPQLEQYLTSVQVTALDGRTLTLSYEDLANQNAGDARIRQAIQAVGADDRLRLVEQLTPVQLKSQAGRYFFDLVLGSNGENKIEVLAFLDRVRTEYRSLLETESIWLTPLLSDEQTRRTSIELLIMGVFVVLAIALVLLAQFETLGRMLAVLLAIPFSIAFAFVVNFFAGFEINVMSLLGIIFILGICVNDSILLGGAFMEREEKVSSPEMQRALTARISARRFRPIWMTTITSVAGIAPMLFLSGPLAQLWQPLSVTLLAGLVAATVSSIYVLPLSIMPRISTTSESMD